MEHEVVAVTNSLYQYVTGNNVLSWVLPKDGVYFAVNSFSTCKDYLHESICDYIWEQDKSANFRFQTKKQIEADLDNDPLTICIGVGRPKIDADIEAYIEPIRKKLNGLLLHINYYEKLYGWDLTTLSTCILKKSSLNHDISQTSYGLILHLDNRYYKAFPLVHLIITLIRQRDLFDSMRINDIRSYFCENVTEIEQLEPKDIYGDKLIIYKCLIMHNYFKIVLENFDQIYKDKTIEDIFIRNFTHEHYGISALSGGYYHIQELSDTVVKKLANDLEKRKSFSLIKRALALKKKSAESTNNA